jgi:cytochrome c oxidase subunit IV
MAKRTSQMKGHTPAPPEPEKRAAEPQARAPEPQHRPAAEPQHRAASPPAHSQAQEPRIQDHATHTEVVGDYRAAHEHHGPTLKVYYVIFGLLMILLVVTLGAAAIDLGPLNLPIAMTIAVAKAVLIVMFFMHVYYSSHLVKFFAGAALFWLMIMFVLTLSDYASRG